MNIINESEFHLPNTKATWDKIIKNGEYSDLGQQYEYCFLWWSKFKDKVIRKELVLLVNESDENACIWPLMSRKQYFMTGLHVIGQIDGIITDYAPPIIANSNVFADQLHNVIYSIIRNKIKWNYLKINIPAWSGLLIASNEIFEKLKDSNLRWLLKTYDKYAVIDLKTDFEDYVSNLGSRTRADIRRYLRIFNSGGFEFRIIEGNELLTVLPKFEELNKANWGTFTAHNAVNHDFLEALLKRSVEIANGKIIMPVLSYNGDTIAAVLGYMTKDICYLHTAGVQRRKVQALAPGITLYALIIQILFIQKVQKLDLSPGLEEYKIRLGAKVEEIKQLVVFNNWRSALFYKTSLKLLNFVKTLKKRNG